MPQEFNVVRKKVSRFGYLAKAHLPVRKILLFGSYVSGKATDDSDIDVAVVIGNSQHKKRFDYASNLMHLAGEIDCNIEPKIIFIDEYENCEPASIVAEIIRTSVEID